jgi:hypothetical protein
MDPSTGNEIGRIARGTSEDIDAAVAAARGALDGAWGKLTAAERGRLLARLGTLVTENAEALAEMEATDVGKPLTQARADVTALARYCEFYAGAADKVMGQTIPFQQGFTVYTLREPIGVTGHIVPWNYPMQIIGRSLGAALAMGNACVLKPAEEACLTALAFADLARQAGFPGWRHQRCPGPRRGGGRGAHRPIPASAMSPSPARSPRAASCRPRPRRTSFPSRWSWAASPRSWFSRCRSRQGPALPRERGAPERGADLFGLLPHPRGAVAVGGSGRSHGRRLPHQGRCTCDGGPGPRPPHLRPPEGDRHGLSRPRRTGPAHRGDRSPPTRRTMAITSRRRFWPGSPRKTASRRRRSLAPCRC